MVSAVILDVVDLGVADCSWLMSIMSTVMSADCSWLSTCVLVVVLGVVVLGVVALQLESTTPATHTAETKAEAPKIAPKIASVEIPASES